LKRVPLVSAAQATGSRRRMVFGSTLPRAPLKGDIYRQQEAGPPPGPASSLP